MGTEASLYWASSKFTLAIRRPDEAMSWLAWPQWASESPLVWRVGGQGNLWETGDSPGVRRWTCPWPRVAPQPTEASAGFGTGLLPLAMQHNLGCCSGLYIGLVSKMVAPASHSFLCPHSVHKHHSLHHLMLLAIRTAVSMSHCTENQTYHHSQ